MVDPTTSRYEDAVGLDLADPVEFRVDTTPVASPIIDAAESIGSLSSIELATRLAVGQLPTVLDEMLYRVPVPTSDRGDVPPIEVNVPTPRDVVVAAPLPGPPMPTMIIYPPPTTRQHLAPGMLLLPTFRVTYVVMDVPPRSPVASVSVALDVARHRFEGDVCFDLLMKAVRSQRNVIKEPFGMDAIGDAMLILERDGFVPRLAVLNPNAHATVRAHVEEHGGSLRGMGVVTVVPSRRGSEGRSYFMASPIEVGTIAKSDPEVSRERQDDGCLSISWSVRLGIMVTNRATISSIDD